MRVSRTTKLLVAGGAVLLAAAVVAKLVVLRPAAVAAPPAPAAAVSAPLRHAAPKPRPAAPRVDSSLPAALRAALARHETVVAVLYARGTPGADAAVAAGRAGARAAGAGFAALDVGDETVARALAPKLPGTGDPAVLVLGRPGRIAYVLSPSVGADVVAQAAVDAR